MNPVQPPVQQQAEHLAIPPLPRDARRSAPKSRVHAPRVRNERTVRLGAEIARMRGNKMNQEMLGQRLGQHLPLNKRSEPFDVPSQAAVSRYERGENDDPGVEMIRAFERALGMRNGELLILAGYVDLPRISVFDVKQLINSVVLADPQIHPNLKGSTMNLLLEVYQTQRRLSDDEFRLERQGR